MTVYLIRGDRFDLIARHTADMLAQAGATVFAVMDERKGEIDTAPFPKITLDDGTPAQLGLVGIADNWGWFCGDVCYYAARQALPDFDHYCLIESDVGFPADSAARLVRAFSPPPADIIAVNLGKTTAPRRFSRSLAALDLDSAWGCIFPLTCVSGAAVDAMLALRRRATAAGLTRLNDEGVLGGTAQQHGFAHAALQTLLPDLFPPATFETNPPHLAEAVLAGTAGTSIFHPVIALDRILARIHSGEKNYTPLRMRHVLQQATPKQRLAVRKALQSRP